MEGEGRLVPVAALSDPQEGGCGERVVVCFCCDDASIADNLPHTIDRLRTSYTYRVYVHVAADTGSECTVRSYGMTASAVRTTVCRRVTTLRVRCPLL